MKNNNGLGAYEIGERHELGCGCVIVAEEVGYTHYINPSCELDNRYHPPIKGYQYKSLGDLNHIKAETSA